MISPFTTPVFTRTFTPFGAIKIIESAHATSLPKGKPQTDDTKEMIEHFDRLGLIQRVPAAFETPAGMVVHPTIAAKLRERCAEVSGGLRADLDRMAARSTLKREG